MFTMLDWRNPVPLLVVIVLHAALLWALQAGTKRSPIAAPMRPEVVARLIPPIPPKAPDRPVASLPPRPVPAPRAERPRPKPAAQPAPRPSVPAAPAPEAPSASAPMERPVAQAPALPAPEPAEPPAAPPVPAVTPAPVAVTAPRFDAAYLNNPAPAYPPLSRRMGEEGKVLLRVLVSSEGEAMDVVLRTSSGSPRLDEAAREAVRSWRFVPARQGDKRVAAWTVVPISFDLNDVSERGNRR